MFPKLRIHSWGGFGSQLNALAVALTLNEKFPSRKIHLVVHTSGLTERNLEIEELIPPNITFEVVSDFAKRNKPEKKLNLRQIFWSILRVFPLVTRTNSTGDLNKLYFWTLAVRGHYSQVTFPDSVIFNLADILELKINSIMGNQPNVVHYRLGDLLFLDKDFVDPNRLIHNIREINQKDWIVLSDSIEYATKVLSNSQDEMIHMSFLNVSPIQVLKYAINAKVFIGTNSKLSIWASIFRLKLHQLDSYMPYELKENLSKVIGAENDLVINYY